MRKLLGLALLCAAVPTAGQSPLAIRSTVFVEHGDGRGTMIEPAARFARGDSVVTVVTWQGADSAGYTIVSAVPGGLELESLSRDGVELSTDGGRNWRLASATDGLPRRVTHLRWRSGAGGRLSYRAVVR